MPNDDPEITLPGEEENIPADDDADENNEPVDDDSDDDDDEEDKSSEDDSGEEKDGESKEEEQDEDKEKDENDDDKDDDENDDSKKKPENRFSRPTYRDIKEKFPKLFKEFPDLRNAFFREKEFTKIFPTVEDAREAAVSVQGFQQITNDLMRGNPETLLQNLAEANGKAFVEVARNILPTVHSLSKDVFFEMVNPILERFTQNMYEQGRRSGDTNLQKAALLVGKFMTGKLEIPDSSSERREREPSEDERRFTEEKNQFYQERYITHRNVVIADANSQIEEDIAKSIESLTEELPEFQRDKIQEEILTRVNNVLKRDEQHIAFMNSLWRRWAKNGFSAEYGERIVDAYLKRARQVLPNVRSKVLNEAMKKGKTRKVDRTENNTSGREASTGTGKGKSLPNAKEVDWSKTSEKDFLDGKFTLRK